MIVVEFLILPNLRNLFFIHSVHSFIHPCLHTPIIWHRRKASFADENKIKMTHISSAVAARETRGLDRLNKSTWPSIPLHSHASKSAQKKNSRSLAMQAKVRRRHVRGTRQIGWNWDDPFNTLNLRYASQQNQMTVTLKLVIDRNRLGRK
jgi:hypothetical protein